MGGGGLQNRYLFIIILPIHNFFKLFTSLGVEGVYNYLLVTQFYFLWKLPWTIYIFFGGEK